jgi:hypothetical protein
VTQSTVWCLIAAAFGYRRTALAGLAVRLIAAAAAMRALRAEGSLALVPLRDVFGFGVWCAGLAGNAVDWRGTRFRVFSDGRITAVSGKDTHSLV